MKRESGGRLSERRARLSWTKSQNSTLARVRVSRTFAKGSLKARVGKRRRTGRSALRVGFARLQVAFDLAGVLCFFGLAAAPLWAETGLMLIGLPAGASVVSLASGSGRK